VKGFYVLLNIDAESFGIQDKRNKSTQDSKMVSGVLPRV